MKRLILCLAAAATIAAGPALADTYVYAAPEVSVIYESYPAYTRWDDEPAVYVEYRDYERPVTYYHRDVHRHRYHHRHYAGCGHRHGRGHGRGHGHRHGHRAYH